MESLRVTKSVSPLGTWQSGLTAEKVSRQSEEIGFLQPTENGVYFINCVDGDRDQMAVWLKRGAGASSQITPAQFNVRSRVHEYGGSPYVIAADMLFFVNFNDQALYSIALDEVGFANKESNVARQITPANSGLRYADFAFDVFRNRLICVREDHRQVDPEKFSAADIHNTLVSLAIDSECLIEGDVLFQDSDFVSSPCLSNDYQQLAFVSWDHPNMPWDVTQIRVASLAANGQPIELQRIDGQKPGSLLQPRFDSKGWLYFIADWSDWWNLYCIDPEGLQSKQIPTCILPVPAEFCSAQWQLGKYNYDIDVNDEILASYTQNGLWSIARLRQDSQSSAGSSAPWSHHKLVEGLGQIEDLNSQDGSLYFCGATELDSHGVYRYETDSESKKSSTKVSRKIIGAVAQIDAAEISTPELIEYETGNHATAYGLFYPPTNASHQYSAHELPPLLVSVHGGPTSAARPVLNLKLQYWTNRGFAVLDVNHRGSTGWGRAFRQQLNLSWGVVDLQDVVSAVEYLIAENLVDPARVVIHGGSAGGYSVMAGLAHTALFAAGASYYGVSDLEVLARETHKFESRYLDKLIGPYPDAVDIYRERSPIHHLGKIDAPLLLLQGLQDKVVPPTQAEMVCDNLQQKGVYVKYITFPGEGHGFRNLANQVSALEAELAFYLEVFENQ